MSKNIAKLLVGFVLIALVSITMVLINKKGKIKISNKQETASSVAEQAEVNQEKPIGTQGWQTYENKKYGYSFQFPADDFLNGEPGAESDNDMVNTCVYKSGFCIQNLSLALELADEYGTGTTTKNILKLSIKEIAIKRWEQNKVKEENFPNKKVSEIFETNFANKKSYQFYVTDSYDDETGGGIINEELRAVFISDGKNKFEITFGKNNKTQNLIAKTFKFSN